MIYELWDTASGNLVDMFSDDEYGICAIIDGMPVRLIPEITLDELAAAVHKVLRSKFIETHIDPDHFKDENIRASVEEDRKRFMGYMSEILEIINKRFP